MARHKIRPSTICPFYRGEEKKTIYCEGIERDMSTVLAFGKDAKDYKQMYCRADWENCRVARMLAEKYNNS